MVNEYIRVINLFIQFPNYTYFGRKKKLFHIELLDNSCNNRAK